MLIHEYLAAAATDRPDKVALVSGGQRRTYAELQRSADALRAELQGIGVVVGDRVVVIVPNSVAAVIAIFGVAAAGGCLVTMDPSTPPERLAQVIDHCTPTAIVVARDRMPLLVAAHEVAKHRGSPIVLDDEGTVVDALHCDVNHPPPEIAADALVAIIFTSGSTGGPKGVTLTHRSVDSVVATVGEYLHHGADDVVLSVLQLAFGYGLLQLLVTFRHGGRLVLQSGYAFPFDLVKLIAVEEVTGFAGVPTLFALLLRLENISDDMFASVRYLTNAAAAMPQSLLPKMRSMFPAAQIYLMHGQTECLRTSFLPPDEIDTRPASIGRGMPGVDMWLEDDAGAPVPKGGEGELVVRGANVMLGYWNDPVASAAVVRPTDDPHVRVLRTGDLFRTDDDGNFYFVARRDDIIKSRGQKVSPLEIEELLYARPEVIEARVIGVPDDILGNAIRAEVVLAEGDQFDETTIKRYLRRHLEDYKVPHQIVAVDALPKSSSGKILRRGTTNS
ncbi:MAG: AMP-binding protein [Ilumatobacteraceae bacterium]